MKIIEKLSDMIEDELNDAEKYARCALRDKDERPALAQTFYNLAVDELKHMSMLHDEVTRIINEYRAQGEEVPVEMQAIYDYIHRKHIDRATGIRIIMESYKA
jgi:hypothetical protein